MIVFVWTEIKICVYYRLRLQSSSRGRMKDLLLCVQVAVKTLGRLERVFLVAIYSVCETMKDTKEG